MWTDQDVLDAAAEWTWVPEGSRVRDGDLTLIQRPAWVRGHVAVERVASDRPAAELVRVVRARGRERVREDVRDVRGRDAAALVADAEAEHGAALRGRGRRRARRVRVRIRRPRAPCARASGACA